MTCSLASRAVTLSPRGIDLARSHPPGAAAAQPLGPAAIVRHLYERARGRPALGRSQLGESEC